MNAATTTEATQPGGGSPEVSPTLMARGLAVLRIFFGVILFANGLA